MSRLLGGPVANSSKALIALASVTKSFVDDLVAAGGLGWLGGGGGAVMGVRWAAHANAAGSAKA